MDSEKQKEVTEKTVQELDGVVRCMYCDYWSKTEQAFHDDVYGCCKIIKSACEATERKAIAYCSDCMEGNHHSFHTRFNFGCIMGRSIS